MTALAPALGRGNALALVERLSSRALAEGRSLEDVAAAEPQVQTHLDAARIIAALKSRERHRLQPQVRGPRDRALAAREGVRTSMDENQRREAGMSIRRTVLGHAHVDRAAASTTPLTAEFQILITRYAWGEIWTRPGLDVRSRRVLAIGTMVALGRWEELRMHIRAAIREGGFTPDDIKEILLQQAVYCGVPAAHRAFAELSAIVAEDSPQELRVSLAPEPCRRRLCQVEPRRIKALARNRSARVKPLRFAAHSRLPTPDSRPDPNLLPPCLGKIERCFVHSPPSHG